MNKEYAPKIRVISVDHGRTVLAAERLRHALDRHGFRQYPVLSVFCHLEAGRCGVASGSVAVEVDGGLIWNGPELSENLAEQFCRGLEIYLLKKNAAPA